MKGVRLPAASRAAKALAILCVTAAIIPGAAAAGERAMDFELKDQYGNALAYRFPKEKVSVLVFGDRKGSSQVEAWVRPVWDRFGERVDLHGVAVLNSVPSLFRGYARKKFRQNVKYPVLLDFEGAVTKAYGYEGDKANVYVIARDGTIALKLTGEATPGGLERLYAEVDALLASRR